MWIKRDAGCDVGIEIFTTCRLSAPRGENNGFYMPLGAAKKGER
jgi:hypothetical protein